MDYARKQGRVLAYLYIHIMYMGIWLHFHQLQYQTNIDFHPLAKYFSKQARFFFSSGITVDEL